MNKVLIVGAGRIGKAVKQLLDPDYDVYFYDPYIFPFQEDANFPGLVEHANAVVACTPFTENVKIAQVCKELKVAYFDLTEDLRVRDTVKQIAEGASTPFFSQCGLAPGFVNMKAVQMAKQFRKLYSIRIRVGALPENPKNMMQHEITWNVEGLLNEYVNSVEYIMCGRLLTSPSLSGIENDSMPGLGVYEAALTSGGLGSLAAHFEGKVDELNYKTIRYPGHWKYMQFLKNDLGLKANFKEFVDIFKRSVPTTTKDLVAIKITVDGDGKKEYTKVIHAQEGGLTAIQLTTASGVCAVLDAYFKNLTPQNGFVSSEMIDLDLFKTSKYLDCF